MFCLLVNQRPSRWLVFVTSLVFSIFLSLVIGGRGESGEPEKELLASIVDAWKKRQAAIRTFDFCMTGTEFRPQTNITALDLVATGQTAGGQQQPFTLPEISFPIKTRVALDDHGRACLQYDGRTWSAKEKGYVPKSDIDVFDGKTRKSLFARGTVEFPNAYIRKGSLAEVARDARVMPLLIVYRPFDRTLGDFDPAKLKLGEGKGIVEGRKCLILKHGESSVWVDPDRDFVPTRYHVIRRGKLTQSIEVRYSLDEKDGWVPVAWTNGLFHGLNNLDNSVTVRITEAGINTPISDEVFDIPFADGTWVNDYFKNEEYIVRQGNEARRIQPGEFDGTNYQQLLHSDSPGKKFPSLLLIANILILLVIATLVFLRLRRPKHA